MNLRVEKSTEPKILLSKCKEVGVLPIPFGYKTWGAKISPHIHDKGDSTHI